MILMIGSFLLSSLMSTAHADPLYQGLPEQLPGDFPSSPELIEFQQEPSTVTSPLGMRITFNSEILGTPARLKEVFLEKFAASIPHNTHIQILKDSQARDVWTYPVGTRVAHWIQYNSRSRGTFEFRMSEKIANGNWASGSYSPRYGAEPDAPLFLNRYTGSPSFSIQLTRLSDGREGSLSLNRINNQSCQLCHYSLSPSTYQFQKKEDAGPCGFGPMNSNIARGWATQFQRQNGDKPFAQ